MANNWKINETVDLQRGIDGIKVWPHALLVTGDENAHEWNVTVLNNGRPAMLNGEIRAYFVRSDGATVTATGSTSSNVATVTLPEACYAYEGDLQAVMQLIESDVSVTISALLLRVRQISTDVIIDPGTEIPSLDDLLAQIEKLKQATKDANTATTNANQAATNAETRVDDAISSAEGRVDTAVQSAEIATSKANASATKADTATASANTATERANAAAQAAEEIVVEKNIATKDYVAEQIDGIEIGGRNLFIDSIDFQNNVWKTYNSDGSVENLSKHHVVDGNYNGFVVLKVLNSWKGVTQKIELDPGYYTLSAWAKVSNGAKVYSFCAIPGISPENVTNDGVVVDCGEQFSRISNTFYVNTKGIYYPYFKTDSGDGNFWICGIKFEHGNKATDWTPAPEDIFYNIPKRNYLPGCTEDTNYSSWIPQGNTTMEITNHGGYKCIHANGNIKTNIIVKLDYDTDYVYHMMIMFNQNVTANPSSPTNFWCGTTSNGKFEDQKYGDGYNAPSKLLTPNVITANIWADIAVKFHTKTAEEVGDGRYIIFRPFVYGDVFKTGVEAWVRWVKLEKGSTPTNECISYDDIQMPISRRSAITYDYGGANLKDYFGTPKNLHDALAREDYSHISVGDYWPITINGTFRDYGSYSVPLGVYYYNDPDCKNYVDTIVGKAQPGLYYSESAVMLDWDGNDYRYAKIDDCLPYFERTCNNVTVKLEVAGINHYWRYGSKGSLIDGKNHIVFISRDCFPFLMRMRKGDTLWEGVDDNSNPWIESAMFKTLNDETYGVLHLVAETDLGAYIYTGNKNLGMDASMEMKKQNSMNANGWTFYDRGKLFLPSVEEVWGHPFWAEKNLNSGLGNQFAIFRDSRRHISKSFGENGNRVGWWMGSSKESSNDSFTLVRHDGCANFDKASKKYAVPICFIFS